MRHANADASPRQSRRLIIAGGSGFLGTALATSAGAEFDDIVILSRQARRAAQGVRFVAWDGRTVGAWGAEVDGAAAVVNFVGRTVDCRKTPANRDEILHSRVDSVHALASAIRACDDPPAVWVQSGTAHIYGDTADEIHDESSPIGTGFAPEVGVAWEAAFNEASLPNEVRRVLLRISFVLGPNGGALSKLGRLARLGLGGRVGDGQQWMSWLHVDDLTRMALLAISDSTMHGTYVATAPEPARNADFMRALRRAAKRPWSPPTPAALVRLGAWLMRTDPELALLGRRCVPTRLLAEGFRFRFPSLQAALNDAMRRRD